MADAVYRYYFCPRADADKMRPFIEVLKAHGVPSSNRMWEESGDFSGFSDLFSDNVFLLVTRFVEEDWKAVDSRLAQWENEGGISDRWLLARATVLVAGGGEPWEQVLARAETIASRKAALVVSSPGFTLARLGWFWPADHVHYVCQAHGQADSWRPWLCRRLPILEATLIQLDMISNLYRHRMTTISAEDQELSQQLSNILHVNLVPQHAQQKAVDELDEQVQRLSSSYGILAGNYHIVSEGISRISALLSSCRQQLSDPALRWDRGSPEAIMETYQQRLESLRWLAEQLQVSRQNHQAAIDVVESRISILRSRENIALQEQMTAMMEANNAMQKQSLTFQVAASLIEFIVLAYYSLSLWKYLAEAAYHRVPAWALFIIITSFAGTVVYATHLMAERIQGDHHVRGRLILVGVLLAAILTLMIVLSVVLGGSAGIHA